MIANYRQKALETILSRPFWTRRDAAKLVLGINRETVATYFGLALLIDDFERQTPKDEKREPITTGGLTQYQVWVLFGITLLMKEFYTYGRGISHYKKAQQLLVLPEYAQKLSYQAFRYECNAFSSAA